MIKQSKLMLAPKHWWYNKKYSSSWFCRGSRYVSWAYLYGWRLDCRSHRYDLLGCSKLVFVTTLCNKCRQNVIINGNWRKRLTCWADEKKSITFTYVYVKLNYICYHTRWYSKYIAKKVMYTVGLQPDGNINL